MLSPPPRSRTFVALGLVIAAAFALRLTGLGHGLPQHPDEDSLIVMQAEGLRAALAGDPDAPLVEPHYPLVLASALALWPLPAHDAQRESEAPTPYHLERAARPFLRARLLVALLSSLSAPLLWLIARRFVGDRWALLSAALLATSLLHLCLSQSARPHAVLATWILLALWLDLRLLESGRWRDHLLAGVATALALACLHTGASAGLPLLAAQAWRWRRDGVGSLLRAGAAWALVLGIGALAYIPPLRQAASRELSTSGENVYLSGHEFPLSVFDGGGFARMGPLLALTDPLLFTAGLVGLAALGWQLLRKRALPSRAGLLLCIWALPFLLVMGLYNRLPARFLLPLLPILALTAAFAMQSLARVCRGHALARLAPALAVALLLALPGYAAARLAWLRTQPDPAQEAAQWIAQNADREHDLVYLSASANLPLLMREEGGGELFAADFSNWDEYHKRLAPDWLEERAWRTRRLIAGDPSDLASLRQDEEALRALLERPPAQAASRRFAVVAVNPTTGAGESARSAVLAAGGREVWSFDVLRRRCELPELAVDAGIGLNQILCMRRLGLTTIIWELPSVPAAASGVTNGNVGVSR